MTVVAGSWHVTHAIAGSVQLGLRAIYRPDRVYLYRLSDRIDMISMYPSLVVYRFYRHFHPLAEILCYLFLWLAGDVWSKRLIPSHHLYWRSVQFTAWNIASCNIFVNKNVILHDRKRLTDKTTHYGRPIGFCQRGATIFHWAVKWWLLPPPGDRSSGVYLKKRYFCTPSSTKNDYDAVSRLLAYIYIIQNTERASSFPRASH